jgi:ABC-type multidrug transport system ATPase subunit
VLFYFISDTCFSESGALLSFGQRQLFCLARAVLKGCSILVLDEATSNLDCETEMLFLKAANDAFKGKTVITIAVSEELPQTFLRAFSLFTFIHSLSLLSLFPHSIACIPSWITIVF